MLPIPPLMEQALTILNHQVREESTETEPTPLLPAIPRLRVLVCGPLQTINKDITPSEWARIAEHEAAHITPQNSECKYPQVEPDTTPSWYQYTDSNIGSRH